MPAIQKAIQLFENRFPKVVSPKVHVLAEYGTAALFLFGAVFFWRKSKRAALASLICGVAEAGVLALSDSPGGMKHVISFPLHKKIDLGLSSMAATMPAFFAFEDDREKAFFRVQSVLIAGLTALTQFEPRSIEGERERRAA